jgi:hypothetical protein
MLRWISSACVALVIALSLPGSAGAQIVDGTWKLSVIQNGVEFTTAIVKLESQGGKIQGKLVAVRAPTAILKSVDQQDKTLILTLANGKLVTVYEVNVPPAAAKKLTGSYVQDTLILPAILTETDATEIDVKKAATPLDCPPLKQLRTLSTRVLILRSQAAKVKDADKKKALLEQVADADKTVKLKMPALYREVLENHADSPAVFEATLGLLRTAQANEAKVNDVKSWASAGAKLAQAYGLRFEADFVAQVASFLLGQEAYAKLAIGYARQAEKSLTEKSSAADQVRILSIVVRALKATDQADSAKTYDARLDKLETQLDREYLAKMPPFKGTPFAGRKGKSDKAVFMELFTGATCPPCVAADVAFDVLQKTYKPADLVLIQYHLHIPGPDPLTNPDTAARWTYYADAFPSDVRGVPSAIFNGKPQRGLGGPLEFAEKSYEAAQEIIDPLLEIDAGVKLAVHAVRKGDLIDINVQVEKLTAPGAARKLRILLAEETVRYAGSNKIRFHHNVVRAFPGGVEGNSLADAASKHRTSIHISELRGGLNKYLTEYEANERAFQNPARPLEMANLRVIAFVQDDATQEILQAVQVEVEMNRSGYSFSAAGSGNSSQATRTACADGEIHKRRLRTRCGTSYTQTRKAPTYPPAAFWQMRLRVWRSATPSYTALGQN